MLVIFTLDFNKKEILFTNKLSIVNTVLIVVNGLLMGIIIESLNYEIQIILIRLFQYKIVLFNFIVGSLSDLVEILVPLVFAVILIIIRKKLLLKSNLVYFSICFAFTFIGEISFILFFYQTAFSQNFVLIEQISIIFGISFGITVNFFALNFLVKFILSNSPFELINEQYTHSKANFTFFNIFKKGKATEHSKINIDPSLEKIELMLKENNEN